MNEQDDKQLHDRVRQSLDAYRPPYDPRDWVQLQRTLRRRRWWRRGILVGAGFLLLGLVSWLLLSTLPTRFPTSYLTKGRRPRPVPAKTAVRSALPVHQPTATHPPILPKSSSLRSIPAIYSPPVNDNRVQISTAALTPKSAVKLIDKVSFESIRPVESVAFSQEESAITEQVITGNFGPDSTAYRAVTRNLRRWPDAVLVCDLTTSMYPYTTQLVALLKRYATNSSVLGMVFFTDCDSLGQQTRAGGPPGQMFVVRGRNPVSILPVLLHAARNTVRNKDNAENDVEALLFAQNEFPQAKQLILVADNMSTVKDMTLLDKVKKPVHVILCGTTASDTGLAFQTDYATLAGQTNGSLHTLEDDVYPKALTPGTTLRVGSHYYRYSARQKQFKLTPFTHRPHRFLRFIWL